MMMRSVDLPSSTRLGLSSILVLLLMTNVVVTAFQIHGGSGFTTRRISHDADRRHIGFVLVSSPTTLAVSTRSSSSSASSSSSSNIGTSSFSDEYDDYDYNDDDEDEDFILNQSAWQADEGEEFEMQQEEQQQQSSSSPQRQQQQQPVRRLRANKKVPLIAIVGRPNVGKSALVNRIAGTQSGGCIVADESGMTRDRTYRPAEFLGEVFSVVDTGGLVFDEDENTLFAKEIRQQAMVAIDEASAVILVVDGQTGLTALDSQIADFLRKQVLKEIPVLVAVNKCESYKTGAMATADFWSLGLGEPMAVSALHGVGTAELLENMFAAIVKKKSAPVGFGTKAEMLTAAKANLKYKKGPLPWEDETEFKMRKWGIGAPAQRVLDDYENARKAFDSDATSTTTSGEELSSEEINIAIIGRPNVGKSSLLNALFGETRAIVSEVAGTTRDSIDAVMERPSPDKDNGKSTLYRFVDTAGIRRRGKVSFGPEFFMVNRALRAMRRANVVLLILDATAGVTEQDRILAQKICDDGRACVIICNKWDAVVNKDSSTYDKSVKYVRSELPQLRWAPILFLSAATGQRVGKIYDTVDGALEAHRKRVSTAILNEVLRDAILWQPPPIKRSGAKSQAKIYYCSQVATEPPTIVVFCNDPSAVHDNYRRYLDRKFRESINGFEATPIRWIFRGRRQRDMMRNAANAGGGRAGGGGGRSMNAAPYGGVGASGSSPFPHAN